RQALSESTSSDFSLLVPDDGIPVFGFAAMFQVRIAISELHILDDRVCERWVRFSNSSRALGLVRTSGNLGSTGGTNLRWSHLLGFRRATSGVRAGNVSEEIDVRPVATRRVCCFEVPVLNPP